MRTLSTLINKKGRYSKVPPYMLNSGLAIHAKNTVPEHTKRGVVAQVLFCESSQSVTTKQSIQKSFISCYFKSSYSVSFVNKKIEIFLLNYSNIYFNQ